MPSTLIIYKKNVSPTSASNTLFGIPIIRLLWLLEKQRPGLSYKQIYFQLIFIIKYLENTQKTLLTESIVFKNTKKPRIFPRSYIFFNTLRVKNYPILIFIII